MLDYTNDTLQGVTKRCTADEIERAILGNSHNVLTYFIVTVSTVVLFVGVMNIYHKIREVFTQITVVIIGAGPIGLITALIAAQCKHVHKILIYEEDSRFNLEHRSYQITLQHSNIIFLKRCGVDFDHLEGSWHEGCFYTRVGIFLEYLLHVFPVYSQNVDITFGTKFNRDCRNVVDRIPGRKLVICCDGSNGLSSRALGISDECILRSSGMYGAVAAIDRKNETLVPIPEKRVHNLNFDLSAYDITRGCSDTCITNFSLKIFGNSKRRYLALTVMKNDSKVFKILKTVLDKSLMRNIFLKCFNTYKLPDEDSVSESYCLNNMKFTHRLHEIKLSQKMENVAYICDCDMFVISEGESSISYNFNTGLDINIGIKGLVSLQSFIERVSVAETEHSIMACLVSKMEDSDRLYKYLLKQELKEYMFL